MKSLFLFPLFFLIALQACSKVTTQKKIAEQMQSEVLQRYCYVKDIYKENGKYFALIDFIEHKKNSEIDSAISPQKILQLPGEYSYVNETIQSNKFEFGDSAKIIMQTFSHTNEGNFVFNQNVTVSLLEDALRENSKPLFLRSPYKVEIKENKIILLSEIYIP